MKYKDSFESFYDEAHVRSCPICGETHIALHKISLLMGDTVITVYRKNNVSMRTLEGNPTRGVILRRFYDCEFGHKFMFEERFHKGSTYEALKEIPVAPFIQSVDLGVMWRD